MVAIVSLKTQYENLGDQVIGAILVAGLSRRCETLCIDDGVPADYLSEFAARVRDFSGRPIRCVSGSTALRVALGTAMTGRPVWLALSPGDIATLGSSTRQLALRWTTRATFGRVRFLQIGASYSKVDRTTVRTIAALRRYGLMTVRDNFSVSRLGDAGPDLPIVPDLAFGLPYRSGGNRRYLTISVRRHPDVSLDEMAARVGAVAQRGRSAGLEPVLVWQVDRDAKFTNELAHRTKLPVLNRNVVSQGYEAITAIYAKTAVIVSNRLHALLIAAAQGALPLALLRADETKIRGAFTAVGLDLVISDGQEADDQLLAELLTNSTSAHARVAAAFTEGRAHIERTLDGLAL